MPITTKTKKFNLNDYLTNYIFNTEYNLFNTNTTLIEDIEFDGKIFKKYINEFWTSKQRQANSIHEVSYRACFKPQLPNFFINLLTQENDVVYDPFCGRGTTVIEAALMNRNIIANDINPLSQIISQARLNVPNFIKLKERLETIPIINNIESDIDLSMFYHSETLKEILSIKKYLSDKKNNNSEDAIDKWIRMVATNRLTGHSKGFFSVYTLPPNQAISAESQLKINKSRNQTPDYRNTKEIIYKKSVDLAKDINDSAKKNLNKVSRNAIFLNKDSRHTDEIINNIVQLTVTSPPFLDIVQYHDDNWLRCWFNNIDVNEISTKITMAKKIEDWCKIMTDVFKQLYRITKHGGWVAFEVGEVRKGKIKLDEHILRIGIEAGFECKGIMINSQSFTKTANIWGVKNNQDGTNSNRIVIFNKEH